ncbi:MAG TPA: toll/interleukin-1 receptor domain-containing protein [Candidatus Angelobacter sp.]|nr:toll/interleukin-1 receptor domain-containing protein [Candidatus Angelobacter sp.]
MANKEHLKILKQGVTVWNQWREDNTDIRPDLKSVDLSKTDINGENLNLAYLRNANLSEVDLIGADLRDVDLEEANLSRADLSGANLSRANLSGANLSGADLEEADLSEADLSGANLSMVYLGGANLSEATAGYTTFADIDLSSVKGLETLKHRAHSCIGIDTIYLSEGNIPEIFLRGVGVPENFITYMHSLTGTGFDYYSCFISYSTKDQAFADLLYSSLQARGVRCWFAPHDMQPGQKLHEQIDAAIRIHEKLLLILSPNSIHSEWVKTEIAKARKRELDEKRRVLFPILLDLSFHELREWECFDADTGKDSAREIREYFIPDFSKWKDHDAYRQSFEKLLKGLKGDETKAAAP